MVATQSDTHLRGVVSTPHGNMLGTLRGLDTEPDVELQSSRGNPLVH